MKTLYENIRAKDYDEQEDKCDFGQGKPCIICGRLVKTDKPFKQLRLICGGNFITDDEGEFEDDMGWYAVGNACYKKFIKIAK